MREVRLLVYVLVAMVALSPVLAELPQPPSAPPSLGGQSDSQTTSDQNAAGNDQDPEETGSTFEEQLPQEGTAQGPSIITIVLVLVFLILAGIGGWFGWRYYRSHGSPGLDRVKLDQARAYVKKLRDMQVDTPRIRAQLKQAGWPDDYVEEALK